MYPQRSLPCFGEPPLPWRHLLISAARGSPRVGPWVLGVLIGAIEEALGVAPEDCAEADIARLLDRLPEAYPSRRIRPLLQAFELQLDAAPRRAPGGYRRLLMTGGADQADLLHDVALALRADWSRDHCRALLDAHDPDAGADYDALEAVALTLYLWTALECG